MSGPEQVVGVFGAALKRYPRVSDPTDALDTGFD